jgi:hypothetical protein
MVPDADLVEETVMHIHESTPPMPKGRRIHDAEPERDAAREKSDARPAERAVERKPVKAEEPTPARHYGAGF